MNLRCHWCNRPDESTVIGWLVELRSGGSTWEVPVCDEHVVSRRSPTYAGDAVVFRPLNGEPVRHGEPCGAHAVLERDHGSPSLTRWCERSSGVCPFPGADVLDGADDRPCAARTIERYAVNLARLVAAASS